MLYLSDLLNKKVYLNRKIFGEMVDFAVQEHTANPTVSKIVIKTKGKKLTISPTFLTWKGSFAILNDEKAPLLPFDEGDFYLNEDLLDKQVIDIDDKITLIPNQIKLLYYLFEKKTRPANLERESGINLPVSYRMKAQIIANNPTITKEPIITIFNACKKLGIMNIDFIKALEQKLERTTEQ